jgi:hypothetical protein
VIQYIKIPIFTFICTILISNCNAQSDTIFTNNEKIVCIVKKSTQDAVEYTYPGEEMINTLYKNTIQKIVFKSGRVQVFAETTSYKTVRSADDFENVTFTSVQSEVNGLYKLGEVSAKAAGTTVYSSMEKVKERAYKKMKIVAAMMGSNIIYLTQNSTIGNQVGSAFQAGHATATNVSGVAYSNKIPKIEDFKNLIEDKKRFQCVESYKMSQRDSDLEYRKFNREMLLLNIENESGLIIINAKIGSVDNEKFRVISFNNEEFIIMVKDGEKIYNYKIRFNM